ncbi:MAG: hypothetical protein IPP14_00740 [Planctomycetes bacterium]|nr:hypothetical protein [Planctomycetota bacterium]
MRLSAAVLLAAFIALGWGLAPLFAQKVKVQSADDIAKLPPETRAVCIYYPAAAADIKPLSSLKGLEEIELDAFDIGDAVVAALPKVKRLTFGVCTKITVKSFQTIAGWAELETFKMKVGTEDASCLKALAKLKLKSLTIAPMHMMGTSLAGAGVIEAACAIATLETLDIDCGLPGNGQAAFAGLAKMPNLTTLLLQRLCPDAKTCSSLFQANHLKSLSVSMALDFSPDCLQDLSKCAVLESVTITGCLRINDTALAHVQRCKGLKCVIIRDCRLLTKAAVDTLTKELVGCVVNIDVAPPGTYINALGAEQLAALPPSTSLINFDGSIEDLDKFLVFDSLLGIKLSLHIDRAQKESANSAALAKALEKIGKKHTELREFQLDCKHAGDDCVKAILNFGALEWLKFMTFGSVSSKAFKTLPKLTKLTWLGFERLLLDKKDYAGFMELVAGVASLRTLELTGYAGASSDFKSLAAHKSLQNISLSAQATIDDELMEHLSQITTLTTLYVGNNSTKASLVTDAGIAHLGALVNATTIMIEVGSQVTDAATSAVRKKLSKCRTMEFLRPR